MIGEKNTGMTEAGLFSGNHHSYPKAKFNFLLERDGVKFMDDPLELAKRFVGTPVRDAGGTQIGVVTNAEFVADKNHIEVTYQSSPTTARKEN